MAGAMTTASPGTAEPLQWRPQRAERTKAVPKHTLCGTTLEPLTKKELSAIEKIDVEAFNKEMLAKVKDPSQPPLPDSFKLTIHDRGRAEESRSRLALMREEAMQAERERRQREMGALSFRGSYSAIYAHPRGATRQYPGFYTKQDLAHANEINTMGLSKKGSYNYDKYGKQMPVHKYSMMGDILKPGNDFNTSTSAEKLAEAVARGSGSNANQPEGGEAGMSYAPRPRGLMDFVDTAPLVDDIPPNIRHKFGSKVVESVLQDQGKVADTLIMQKEMYVERRKLVDRLKDLPEIPPSPSAGYDSLGRIGRSNVFPGRNINVNAGVIKTTHNDEVYLHRDPPTDEFKYKRDHLSMWNEQHFLWLKMNKRWEDYIDSLPKYEADWDRTAKRPPPTAPAPKPKAKPKPKPKPKAKEEPAPPSPEIKFVTPPLTPPPPAPAPAPMPQKVERDDEFWSFYDQSMAK